MTRSVGSARTVAGTRTVAGARTLLPTTYLRKNICGSPGFETGSASNDPWWVNGIVGTPVADGFTRSFHDNTFVLDGSYAAQMEASSTSQYYLTNGSGYQSRLGKYVVLSAWIYFPPGSSALTGIGIAIKDFASYNTIAALHNSTSIPSTGVWTKVWTISKLTSYTNLRFSIADPNGRDGTPRLWYCDRVLIEEYDYDPLVPANYFDGDTPGASWLGTPGASQSTLSAPFSRIAA